MNAILLSFGKSVEGVALFNAIRDYADELGVPQKTLLMMGLHEFMLVNRDMDFVYKIEKYQEYDGRRKTSEAGTRGMEVGAKILGSE